MKTNKKIKFNVQRFNYKQELPMYIAGGNPSEDTLRHYNTEINNYLTWCDENGYNALKDITEHDAFNYLRYLTSKSYSIASINLKISAARTYYYVANKLNLIDYNPFTDIKPKKPTAEDTDFNYFTTEEIKQLINVILEQGDIATGRDIAMVMLMSVEGLRTVEIHRMSDEDFDWRHDRILIHGKGKDSYIYPCSDTLDLIKTYLGHRPTAVKDDEGTPTFIGYSKKFFGERISRNGIRFAMNERLKAAGLKRKGESCHILRHSCGTNLYAETKDLRLVQEVLRHSDPQTTSRYAHLVDRTDERKTRSISPFNNK